MSAALELLEGPQIGRGQRAGAAPSDVGRSGASVAGSALVIEEPRERLASRPQRYCTSCAAQDTPLHRSPCRACAAPDFPAWRPMSGPARPEAGQSAACPESARAAPAPRQLAGRPFGARLAARLAGIARWAGALGALLRLAATERRGAPARRRRAAAAYGGRPDTPVRFDLAE